MGQVTLDRRAFLVSAAVFGGGMAVSLFAPPAVRAAAANARPWTGPQGEAEFSAWVAITPEGEVIVRVPTPEIGNGAMTQVAMNVTEELACDWSRVRVEFASARRDYLEDGVYSKGKGTLPFFGGHSTDPQRLQHCLQVGASARERLKAAAAARWQVPVAEIEARDSVLTHKPSGRTLRYGDVAAEAAGVQLEKEPAPKPRSEWTFLGKASPAKVNLPEIVNGSAVYGIDVKLPDMVHAAVKHAPVHGGRLKSHEPGAVKDMPGVRAVVVLDSSKTVGAPVERQGGGLFAMFFGGGDGTEMQSGVAVIADHYWQAKKALDALPVEWDNGPGESVKTTEQMYAAAIEVLDKGDGKVERETGDVDAVTGAKTVEGTYVTPFCEHATMEPINSTALVSKDRVEVWHPGQDGQQALWVAVDETGMMPENVNVHQTYVGGGFGRRVMASELRTACAIAREYPGVPVKMIWSREESTRQGRYRTMIATRYRARLDDEGMPLTLEGHACFAGLKLLLGFMDTPYVGSGAIPNARFSHSDLPLHIMTGAYRAPCYNSHAFILETFIDECAVAAGIDPLEYRLRLLKKWNPAWSQCLRVAAEKAGWGKPLPKGQGRGIAIANWPQAAMPKGGSTVCTVAHVEVSRKGELAVKRLDMAFDCGSVANRDAVAAQLEGGAIFGMNMTLNEELTVRDGAVVEGNFDRYPMVRMRDTPEIHVHFGALSGDERLEIIGEAPVGPVGPAIGNAIFQATGRRLRRTPFRKLDLSWR